MVFSTKHNIWRRRFAVFPAQIGPARYLWWDWYEWRWIGPHCVKFEVRAVGQEQLVFRGEIPLHD